MFAIDDTYSKLPLVVTKNQAFDAPIRRGRSGEYKIPPKSVIYTCFTSDFFHDDADKWRDEAWRMINERSDCHFHIYTKRTEHLARKLPNDWGEGYDNVTIGVSCENQEMLEKRAFESLYAPIKHRMIICEPLLEPMDLTQYLSCGKFEAVVVGGESAKKPRICRHDWVMAIRAQCKEYEVDFAFHQTGSWFEKDGRNYRIYSHQVQQEQAFKAGINTGGLQMDFDLEVLDEEQVKQEVKQELAVPDERLNKVSSVAVQKAEEIFSADIDDFATKQKITDVVTSLGSDVVKKSGERCAILKTRIGELSRAGGETGELAKNYKELVVIMKELDPKAVDFGAPEGGLLKKIMNPVRKYFAQYERADKAIGDIVKAMNNGIKMLKQDNVTLGIHQQDLRDLTKQLIEKDKMAEELDTYLSDRLEQYRLSPDCDEDRVRFVESDILYNLRQNRLTYGQMIAVNEQSFLTDEVIRRGNVELIRCAERARDVSVAAMQTGAVAAAALYHQQVMLRQIDQVTEATNRTIASVSEMLKTQGRDIAQKAMSTNIDIDVMRKAFEDAYETYDIIESSRKEALPVLAKAVGDFREIADKGEQMISRIERSSNRG